MFPITVALDYSKFFKLHFTNAALLVADKHLYVLPYVARTMRNLERDLHAMIRKNVTDHTPVKGARYISKSHRHHDVDITNSGMVTVKTSTTKFILESQHFHLMIPKFNAKEYHHMLWSWLAKTGKRKEQWPNWESNYGYVKEVFARCFACEESMQKRVKSVCVNCPIDWKFNSFGQNCANSVYGEWARTHDKEKKMAFARKVLNLKYINAWA